MIDETQITTNFIVHHLAGAVLNGSYPRCGATTVYQWFSLKEIPLDLMQPKVWRLCKNCARMKEVV